MNNQTLEFIKSILDSDLSKQTKEEIVRFYSLPRNTPIKPALEFDEEESKVGAVDRPSAEDIILNNNPKLKEEQEDMRKLLGEK